MITLEPSKYLRYFSDIHQDFYVNAKKFSPNQLWNPEPLPEDKETTLILAGDLWHAKKIFTFANYSWLKELSSKFQHILIVLGNHDFWGGSFPTEYANFDRYKEQFGIDNLYLLQDNTIYIGNNKFIGATLWTNYNNKDSETIDHANFISSDLKYIRYIDPKFKGSFKKVHPKHFIEAHNVSLNYIFNNAHKDFPEQKLWVITHHPPTSLLVTDPELDQLTKGVVASSNYDERIAQSPIDFWIHGHNHQSGEGLIGNTKILSNTLGYLSEADYNEKLNSLYNPLIQMKLDACDYNSNLKRKP